MNEGKQKKVYLSLGSNLGNRMAYLIQAISKLEIHLQVVVDSSPFFESLPWGKLDQPLFLNCAVSFFTIHTPHELLNICQGIEKELQRNRAVHWGARTIDIDIIFYEEDEIHDKDLIIPHPFWSERGFVLLPLLALDPNLKSPQTDKYLSELNISLKGVVKFDPCF